MYRHPPQGRIRPKISNMPRQQSEPTAYLDAYKLVVEKKRLQEELQKLEQRKALIQQRLEQLEQQIVALEGNIQQMRQDTPSATPSPASPPPEAGTFSTLMVDY